MENKQQKQEEKEEDMNHKSFDRKLRNSSRFALVPLTCALILTLCVLLSASFAYGADKLVVKDSGGNTKFVVNDSGQVGVGTATPSRILDIFGGVPIMQNSGTAGFDFKNAGATFAASISVGSAGNPNLYANWLASTNARDDATKVSWGLRLDIGSDRFRILRAPVAGTFSSLFDMYGDGSIVSSTGATLTSGGVWTNASSRELKENIAFLTTAEATETLENLSPVKYNYKIDKEEKHVGFIAEDVPDLVATKDRKGLSSMDIVAILTKVLQEQRKTVEEQQKTISALQEKIKSLDAQVTKIRGIQLMGGMHAEDSTN